MKFIVILNVAQRNVKIYKVICHSERSEESLKDENLSPLMKILHCIQDDNQTLIDISDIIFTRRFKETSSIVINEYEN